MHWWSEPSPTAIEQSVNLYLSETDLFTGRYEGYLRLTDSNGDGKDSDVDPPITSERLTGDASLSRRPELAMKPAPQSSASRAAR